MPAAPDANGSEPPPRRRQPSPRARRWRRRGLIGAVIVALLAGAGAGLFGSGDDGTTPETGPPARPGDGADNASTAGSSGDGAAPAGVLGPGASGQDQGDAPRGARPVDPEVAGTDAVALAGDPGTGPGAGSVGAPHGALPAGGPRPRPAARPSPDPGPSAVDPAAAGAAGGTGATGSGARRRDRATSAPGAAPAGEFDPDRFASLLALAENRTTTERFAAAAGCLADLRGFDLSAPQRAAVRTATAALQTRMQALCVDVLAAAERGDVLVAAARAEAAWRDGAGPFRATLARVLAGVGLSAPTEPDRAGAIDLLTVPTPRPLRRDRQVRAGIGDERLTGSVADATTRRVTLRVRTPRGLRFPTVLLVDCEPVQATSREAADLGFAALHAGRPLLARLWLHHARARADAASEPAEPPCERTARLLELLQ